MRGKNVTILLLAMLLLVVYAGCERKVTETIIVEQDSDCFQCHGDDGFLLQAKGEWQRSVHASATNSDYANRGGGSDCSRCHNHQGFLEIISTGELTAPYDSVSAIHCFTCHMPHARGDLSLRTVAAVTMADGSTFDHGKANLCANCHQSRVSPAVLVDGFEVTSKYWGPHHGPQGEMINGTGGFEYDNYTGSYASTPHASVVEDACAGCHMGQQNIHMGYDVGGHSFNMEDDEGNQLTGFCANCHSETGERGATYDFIRANGPVDYDGNGEIEGYQTELNGMLGNLAELLVTEGVLDGTNHAVPGTIADANVAGALFNFLIVLEDRSKGIHNFKYMHALLESSTQFLEGDFTGN